MVVYLYSQHAFSSAVKVSHGYNNQLYLFSLQIIVLSAQAKKQICFKDFLHRLDVSNAERID